LNESLATKYKFSTSNLLIKKGHVSETKFEKSANARMSLSDKGIKLGGHQHQRPDGLPNPEMERNIFIFDWNGANTEAIQFVSRALHQIEKSYQ
jgi:hypothetical protein